ncbi:MAG: hypothetical protein GY849_17960 [Deltaproteobacteria bacterium]|nr:hypothetical protein [Deltaproteobacteria bacterium]
MTKIKQYEKYEELPDRVLKWIIEQDYKEEHLETWTISDIAKLNKDSWIIKWKRKPEYLKK